VRRHEANWLALCQLAAPLFSTCARRHYFAVVLAPNRRVAGIGYNGAPAGMTHCVDGGCPRGRSSVPHGSDYASADGFCVAQHAEAGALLWSDPVMRQGGTLVVNGPPCLECARLVASAGIARVVHTRDDAYAAWPTVAAYLADAGVEVVGA
jgi:dCMP deaminase